MTGTTSQNDGIEPDPTPLPSALSSPIATLFDLEEPPETTLEWARAIRETVSTDLDRELGIEDLCHADRATPHVAHAGEETYRFLCPVDGLVLARLAGAAAVETECPTTGTAIEVVVGDEELRTVPDDVVFSFGLDPAPPDPDAGPTPALAYGAVCPHVRGFVDRAAYREWASDHDAPTIAVSPRETLRMAGAIVDE